MIPNIDMKKIIKKQVSIVISILQGCILLYGSTVQAQLTGPMRDDFIQGSAKTCFKTQRAGTPNAELSDATLMKYCKCSMTYQADLLNNQLALDIANGKQKLNPAFGQMAQQYCQKNYTKY
jgi:hypothetical protein